MTTEFLASAPLRIVVTQSLGAPREALFSELTDDASTWPTWFREVSRASYIGPPPYGVGAGRSVALMGGVRFVESVQIWEAPERFVYRVEEANLAGPHAWLEEWLLTEDAGGGTTVRFTMAIEAHAAIELLMRATRPLVEQAIRRAMKKLDARVRDAQAKDAQAEDAQANDASAKDTSTKG
ncbi:SRPBCC family protein [Streptacidiphilus sp. MAP12-20]|uniref:SRPBCC family protein n=1 Tax=Streptacidiphilus sp. MAP12-20 TaxID=3156299 RepID=UPI003516AA0C